MGTIISARILVTGSLESYNGVVKYAVEAVDESYESYICDAEKSCPSVHAMLYK